MYPRQKTNEKETHEINFRPKIQYFSKMPAVLTVFIKTYNDVIFFLRVLVENEMVSWNSLIYLLRYHIFRVLDGK